MNLGDQLRETLGEEADMQYATPPDVDRLIIGGRQRRRHRNLVRAGGAALALVLIGGGAYAVLQTDRRGRRARSWTPEGTRCRGSCQRTRATRLSSPGRTASSSGAAPTAPPSRRT